MSDMISRQKLIEELEERRSHMIPDSDGKHSVSIEKVIDYISKFPPADQWIPCSERLPEPYQHVLVTAPRWQTTFLGEPTYFVDIAHCDCEGAFHLKTARTRQYATAWMPLPEPYKGVE